MLPLFQKREFDARANGQVNQLYIKLFNLMFTLRDRSPAFQCITFAKQFHKINTTSMSISVPDVRVAERTNVVLNTLRGTGGFTRIQLHLTYF